MDDSAWREVLKYFSSATQIGMTATPKETKDISNIVIHDVPVMVVAERVQYYGNDGKLIMAFGVCDRYLEALHELEMQFYAA